MHRVAINDTMGHPAGDAVLQTVARIVRSALRSSDVVARLGGDDPECTDIRILCDVTRLGDTSQVTCPNGELGPCDTAEKRTPRGRDIIEPPSGDGDDDIFGHTDCITHEFLERNTVPTCDESREDVMQCGGLVPGEWRLGASGFGARCAKAPLTVPGKSGMLPGMGMGRRTPRGRGSDVPGANA